MSPIIRCKHIFCKPPLFSRLCAYMQQPFGHDPPPSPLRIVVVNAAYVWTAPDLDVLFSKEGGRKKKTHHDRRSPPAVGVGEPEWGSSKPLRSVRPAPSRPGQLAFFPLSFLLFCLNIWSVRGERMKFKSKRERRKAAAVTDKALV